MSTEGPGQCKCAARVICDLALLLAAMGLPLCLVWDYAWESTLGIDLPWSPPHTSLVALIALAGLAAMAAIHREEEVGVRLLGWEAPLGMWVALWGTFVFATAYGFDRWWQVGYGAAAGIWHPPQWLKALAFGAVLMGAWLRAEGKLAFAGAGAAWLVLLSAVTIPAFFANRQHSAAFYEMAAAAYPIVLVAQARAGRGRWPATAAALGYLLLWGAMVWVLPLFRAEPQVSPIFQPRSTLLPPPFPLLLIFPALAIDLLRREGRFALEAGISFFVVFVAIQWSFAAFLLSPASAGWFFAGGGREWPFFLQLSPSARTSFWMTEGAPLNLSSGLVALAYSLVSAQLGWWIGSWRATVRR